MGYFSPMPVLKCFFKYILIVLFLFSLTFQSPQWLYKPLMRAHELIPACQYFLPFSQRPPKAPHTRWDDTFSSPTFSSPTLCCSRVGLNRLRASQEHVWREGMAQKDQIQVLEVWIGSVTSQLARFRGCQASGKQFITSFSLFKTKVLSQPICIVYFIWGGRHTSSKKSKLKPNFEFALWF